MGEWQIEYPNLKWITKPDGSVTSINNDFALVCYKRTAGEMKGTWAALINNSSLISGRGRFGYEFDDQHHAAGELEKAMRQVIDARVQQSLKTLLAYTNIPDLPHPPTSKPEGE